jgi:PAS domain S-box-containing protein
MNNHYILPQVAFDYVPYPLWVIEAERLSFLAVNKSALRFYGYTETEFLNMSLTQICVDTNLENLSKVGSYKTTHQTKNGAKIWVEVTTEMFDFNGKTCICYAIVELSEQQQLLENLRQSEAHFRSLVENSDDMIMRFDREFRHLYANPVIQKYLGIKAEDTLGKTHLELGFPKEQCDYWDSKIEQVFKTGKMLSIVSEENPAEFCFHWDLIPEFDAEGNVLSVLSVTRDITEYVKAKSELAIKEKQLKEAKATEEKLKAIFAKDVRWPLVKG